MNTPRPVIVVFGQIGSGKDTFANALAEELDAVRIAFADPIKCIASDLLGIPIAVSYGSQEDKERNEYYGKSAREWLQWIGTELGRDMVDKDVWIKRAADTIRMWPESKPFVISDGRFSNELYGLATLLPECTVWCVRVKRPGINGKYGHGSHASETEQTDIKDGEFDLVINNIGSVEDLTFLANAFALTIQEEDSLAE